MQKKPTRVFKINETQKPLTTSQLKKLMVSQIFSGMCANPRREKFDDEILIKKAIDHVNLIFKLTP